MHSHRNHCPACGKFTEDCHWPVRCYEPWGDFETCHVCGRRYRKEGPVYI